MSRLKEALVFKTDEERLEWFRSLTPEEQAEVIRDVQEIMKNVEKALEPITIALQNWVDTFVSNMAEIGEVFSLAQARANSATRQRSDS